MFAVTLFIRQAIIFIGLSYRTFPGKRFRGTGSSSTSLTNSIEMQSFTHSALSKCKTVCRVISDTCQSNPRYLHANSKKAQTNGGILLTLRLLLVVFPPKHKPLALPAEFKINAASTKTFLCYACYIFHHRNRNRMKASYSFQEPNYTATFSSQ